MEDKKVVNAQKDNKQQILFRADKIDLQSLDRELAKHMVRFFDKAKEEANSSVQKKKQDWELDFSKLQIKGAIAHGEYGTVHSGVYCGQDVAVKVIDLGHNGQSSFDQEVAAWRKLDHPNVTKFLGAASHLKIPTDTHDAAAKKPSTASCVVLEYLPGGTLRKYLDKNRRKRLPLESVIQFGLDLAKGLKYLHSKKIVHRDIKPVNLLLDAKRRLKIADFGLARMEAKFSWEMTGVTGTIAYMAPEVISSQGYDHKADVYSFGVCLWEIYCCTMPYPRLTIADISAPVVYKNLRPKIPRHCPRSLSEIMRRCWDANPQQRPEMDEVVRLLEGIDTTKGSADGCFCFG